MKGQAWSWNPIVHVGYRSSEMPHVLLVLPQTKGTCDNHCTWEEWSLNLNRYCGKVMENILVINWLKLTAKAGGEAVRVPHFGNFRDAYLMPIQRGRKHFFSIGVKLFLPHGLSIISIHHNF